MINYLEGKPVIHGKCLTVLINGVGYAVQVGERALAQLERDQVSLHVYTHVREDRIELYGFLSIKKKQLFELLIDVSGIGPKTALDICDRDSEAVVSAVQNSDVSFFNNIPRIGKKTAQKIILELKSKLGSLKELNLGPRSAKESDLYEALGALGYLESEIAGVVTELDFDEINLEDAVKFALKQLTS